MLELALHILDVLQNAVEAGATRVTLTIDEDYLADRLAITVTDNGRGMDAETLARVKSPFFTTRQTRHVGLGLPLYSMAAEQAGGVLTLRSAPGRGTAVEAVFRLSDPDRQPLGDLPSTLLAFLLSARPVDFEYTHRETGDDDRALREFSFTTAALRAELGDLPFNHPLVAQWLAAFLREGETQL